MKEFRFRLSEESLVSIFNHIDENICLLDKDLNVLWTNKTYLDKLGMSSEEVLGKKCYSLWHKRLSPCEGCSCVKALKSGKEEVYERISDEERYWIITAVPLKNEDKIEGVFEFAKEITDKKIIYKKLRETIKIEGIYEIIDNLSHQYSNILNGIYGFAQLLKKETKDEKSLNFLEKLIESVEKASKFKEALLALKKSPSLVKVFDLNFLIISMKNLLKEMADEKIKFEFSLSKENPLIKGDPQQIREILIELVLNAKNAMSEDGVISISTEKIRINSEEKVVFTVSDNGVGMDKETLEKCFEPFFTNDPRRFGLGLSIVKNIVQKHNGTIQLISSPQNGTTVKIFFPSATLQQAQGI
jgi:PAS domain S-box-containing protein